MADFGLILDSSRILRHQKAFLDRPGVIGASAFLQDRTAEGVNFDTPTLAVKHNLVLTRFDGSTLQ